MRAILWVAAFRPTGFRSTGENNFLLNGVDNNVNVIDFINQTSFVIGPSVEAIGNMQVITNGASAEYGRAAGGVLDVSLKSGTNEIHGVLFEILQNTVLDANRWENNLAGVPRNPFKQNQFGAAVGAPIIKNKLFIFGDYQGTRISTAGGSIQNLGYGGFYTIPTPAMVGGDFSNLLGKPIGSVNGQNILQNELFNPTSTTCLSGCVPGTLTALSGATPNYTRSPYPGNRIPTTAMDAASMKIASLYPAPNQAILGGTYPQNDLLHSNARHLDIPTRATVASITGSTTPIASSVRSAGRIRPRRASSLLPAPWMAAISTAPANRIWAATPC